MSLPERDGDEALAPEELPHPGMALGASCAAVTQSGTEAALPWPGGLPPSAARGVLSAIRRPDQPNALRCGAVAVRFGADPSGSERLASGSTSLCQAESGSGPGPLLDVGYSMGPASPSAA